MTTASHPGGTETAPGTLCQGARRAAHPRELSPCPASPWVPSRPHARRWQRGFQPTHQPQGQLPRHLQGTQPWPNGRNGVKSRDFRPARGGCGQGRQDYTSQSAPGPAWLRDPATSSSLLLNYSDYYLFVVFLHLTACLVHLIGGLLPYLPIRLSPTHYWGLFISSEAAAAHPAAPSPPAQAAGGGGGRRAGATAGPPAASTATVLARRCHSSLLLWLTSAQATGHGRSWQSAGETARAWLSLQSAGERSEARRCASACREGHKLLGTEVAAEWRPRGRVTAAGHRSPQRAGRGESVSPNPGAAAAPPGSYSDCCSRLQAGASGRNVGRSARACLSST